jgi:DNA repair protein RadC
MLTEKDRDDDAGFPHDSVTFYSRLTHTVENVCGRERLAACLSEERRRRTEGAFALPAFARAFRRLGFMEADQDAAAFAGAFVRRLALAVSRPENQVLMLLRFFAGGDETLEVKAVCGPTPQCAACQLTRDCDYFNKPRKPEMALLPPAARLLAGKAEMLSDSELLAVILFGDKATGREPIVAVLLARYGRTLAISRADAHEFQAIRDMGKPQALRLAAFNVFHARLLEERRGETLRIACARDIYDRYASELRDSRVESAVLLMLDNQNTVIRDAWFGQHSSSAAQVAIGDLLRPAIREVAARVALIHNHPGNNPNPSASDLDFTRRLRSACDILGIGLVDHVIVAEAGYYSFAEQGMLGG